MTNGYLIGSNLDAIIQNNPTSFIRSGRYEYGSGGIYGRSSNGYYWQSRVTSEIYARNLSFLSTYLVPQYGNDNGSGFTVRCLVR